MPLDHRLAAAFEATSPRIQRHRTPWRSVLIHGGVLVLWGLFVVLAVIHADDLWAWSMGLGLLTYDTALLAFTFLACLRLMRRSVVPGSSETPPVTTATAPSAVRLGVIVAARNEAGVLQGTLTDLLAQVPPPDQIVIADDGSFDGTADLLTRHWGLTSPPLGALSSPSRTHPTLHWLRLPHGGKARALNAALVRMQVETVLTVDADTLLEPGALAAVRSAFAAEAHLVAATGVLSPFCGSGLRARLLQGFQTYEYVRNFLARYAWMRADGLLLISGAFAGFRRQAVVEVGGFDPESLVEDYELIHRLRRHSAQRRLNWTTAVLGQARARTEAPSTLTAFIRQRRRWFGGFLQTQFWYRDMVGSARYGRVGTRMLPVKAVDTLQPLFGLTAVAILMACVWRGQSQVLLPVAGVMAAKLALDLAFRAWSVRTYARWAGGTRPPSMRAGLWSALLEPFSFQLLCQVSAVVGWMVFLSGRMTWGRQERAAGRAPDDLADLA